MWLEKSGTARDILGRRGKDELGDLDWRAVESWTDDVKQLCIATFRFASPPA